MDYSFLHKKYFGLQDETRIECKDKIKYFDNGKYIKTINYKFDIKDNSDKIYVDIHDIFSKEILGTSFKYFLTNYNFSDPTNIVSKIDIEYGSSRINRIILSSNSNNEYLLTKFFFNLPVVKYNQFRFIFYLKRGRYLKDKPFDVLKADEKEKEEINNLIFTFDIYEFYKVEREEFKDMLYEFRSIGLDDIIYFKACNEPNLPFNHPCEEIIIYTNVDDENVFNKEDDINNEVDVDKMKQISINIDGNFYEMKLSKYYKNTFIYSFDETINFSRINKCFIRFDKNCNLGKYRIYSVCINFIRANHDYLWVSYSK